MATQHHESLDERMLHRLLFFTDAVFAIVLTLLVLELKPPESAGEATAERLGEMMGHISAFAMSFLLIGIFWVAHMNTTRRLAHFDWPTAVANLAFLFPVCLLPFASAWFGASISGVFAWTLYCWVLIATSAANMALVVVACRDGGRLIAGGLRPREMAYRLLRAAAPGLAFAIGLLLLQAGLIGWSHFCWVLIPLVFLLARALFGPPRGATAG